MKKRYSHHDSSAGSIPGLVQVSKNTYTYSGFTIRKAPRNHFNEENGYLIFKWDDKVGINNYYGRDFALAEAKRTIDRVMKNGRFIIFR